MDPSWEKETFLCQFARLWGSSEQRWCIHLMKQAFFFVDDGWCPGRLQGRPLVTSGVSLIYGKYNWVTWGEITLLLGATSLPFGSGPTLYCWWFSTGRGICLLQSRGGFKSWDLVSTLIAWIFQLVNPIPSMYSIFTYMYHILPLKTNPMQVNMPYMDGMKIWTGAS